MPSHNIIGCEAVQDPSDRLVHFSHAHGSIRAFPRRRRAPVALLAFLAGAATALVAITLLIART